MAAAFCHRVSSGCDLSSTSLCAWTGFTWLFAMLVTGIDFLVALYARYYMSPSDGGAVLAFLLAFMAPCVGIVPRATSSSWSFFWS
jgi:multicomponent K+:H+ antiporter subunit A